MRWKEEKSGCNIKWREGGRQARNSELFFCQVKHCIEIWKAFHSRSTINLCNMAGLFWEVINIMSSTELLTLLQISKRSPIHEWVLITQINWPSILSLHSFTTTATKLCWCTTCQWSPLLFCYGILSQCSDCKEKGAALLAFKLRLIFFSSFMLKSGGMRYYDGNNK